MAWTIPWNLIGLSVSGDVGGFSIYSDRFNRKVVYPKAPPEKPPSPEQVTMRSRFAQAQAAWSALNDADKQSLEDACRRVWVPMTGQNLYIKVAMTGKQEAADTLSKQSGITLPAIPGV